MSHRYDIAIVGSGPAGLSAALNAKIRNKSFILFGSKFLSSKIQRAPKINNYLGFPKSSGEELGKAFLNHIEDMDIEITEERINNIYSMGDYFALMVNEKIYEAKTVILATGVEFSKPLKGELEYLGKGVGYCATCDAPLYKGKTVCIISSNLEGEGEANYVSELAEKVYYIPLYKNEYKLNSNIELVKDRPIEVCGDIKVAISPSQLVPGLEENEGHIKVDRSMRTNLKGLFACGDCVGKPYQYIKAAGEGNIAALSAVEYLNNY